MLDKKLETVEDIKLCYLCLWQLSLLDMEIKLRLTQ